MRPNQSAMKPSDGLVFHINSRGYRGNDLAIPKPDDVLRVAFIGGSAVFDIGNTQGQDWVSRVGDLLVAPDGQRLEVINASQPGFATAQSLAKITGDLWHYQPDIVVLSQCWNDLKYFGGYTGGSSLIARADIHQIQQDPRLTYANGLDWLLGRSRLYVSLRYTLTEAQLQAGVEGTVDVNEPTQYQAYIIQPPAIEQYRINVNAIVSAIQTIGARPVLMTQPRLPVEDNEEDSRERVVYHYVDFDHATLVDAFAVCDDVMQTIGTQTDTPVFDASADLSGNLTYFRDHVHTTYEGSIALAEWVAPRLQDLIDTHFG